MNSHYRGNWSWVLNLLRLPSKLVRVGVEGRGRLWSCLVGMDSWSLLVLIGQLRSILLRGWRVTRLILWKLKKQLLL